MDDPRIERGIDLPAAPDEVWDAVTGDLDEWFGAEPEGELVEGRETPFRWPDGVRRRALVETVDAPRRLRISWLPREWGPIGDPRPAPASTVEITLTPTSDGTRVTVVEELRSVDPPIRRDDRRRGSIGFEARLAR